MTDSTPPIDAPPEQEAAGVPCRYGTAARAPPPPPIRLQLEVDERLLRLVRSMRSVVAQAPRAAEDDQHPEPPKNKGRRRLRKVAVRSLQLGQRQIAGTDELDIVAKFLYNKPRKIVCQMSRGDSDTLLKIDILWSNIRAMSACFDDASFDTLTIEVKSPAEQYRADPPEPRRHLQWQRCPALTTRTFCFQFDKGTLERSYGKMLYTDPSLMLRTLPPTPPPPPPPPPPPGGNEEDEEGSEESTATQQTVGMITAAAPVPPSVDYVQAEMPGTRMVGFTNTGANVATHQYSGTQSNDPSHPAHMHPLYRWM